MSTLSLSRGQLDSLARLGDDPAALAVLQRARASRNTAFLIGLIRSGDRYVPPESRRPVQAAFDTLAAAQRLAPAAVRRVLEHPRFGAWVALCVASPDGRGAACDPQTHPAAHLASFAASAAVAAGLDFSLELPQVADAVVLPGLGCWTGPTAPTARVCSSGGPARGARPPGTIPVLDGRRWTPLRTLTAPGAAGPVAVEFDDLPATPPGWNGGSSGVPAPRPPLPWTPRPDEEFQCWQVRFDAAIRLLAVAVPHLADPLGRGMRTIRPLGRARGRISASTFADAFGTAAMTTPPDTMAAATGLLHEFQHSKLSVLTEVVPLVAAEGPADLYSPWREDPRPASAVLHGAFAHLSVALLWYRATDLLPADPADEAAGHGELARVQTMTACDNLLKAQHRLTPAGRRFVTIIRETAVAVAAAHPAPRAHRAAAADALGAHQTAWTRRHGRAASTVSRTEQRL